MSDISDERKQEIKAALWLAVGKISDQTCTEDLPGVTASSNFIAALTEYVWEQSQTLAMDLEAFAVHRGSTVIETKDILLYTRRNDALKSIVQTEIDDYAKSVKK